MNIKENSNDSYMFRVRFWTQALIESEDEETIIYNIKIKPRFVFYKIQNMDDDVLQDHIRSSLPKRCSYYYKSKIFNLTYKACSLDDPFVITKDMSHDSYKVLENKIIVPKSSFEGRNVTRPAFILRRDVRKYDHEMSQEQRMRLFANAEAAVEDFELMAIIFATED